LRWRSQKFLPGLASTVILPISASQLARTTGVSHCALPHQVYFWLCTNATAFCMLFLYPQFCWNLFTSKNSVNVVFSFFLHIKSCHLQIGIIWPPTF
jgi:hypothetical protein